MFGLERDFKANELLDAPAPAKAAGNGAKLAIVTARLSSRPNHRLSAKGDDYVGISAPRVRRELFLFTVYNSEINCFNLAKAVLLMQ